MNTNTSDQKVFSEKVVFTVSETAQMLGVHPNTVYKLVKSNAFVVKRIGTDIRIEKESFFQWLQNK